MRLQHSAGEPVWLLLLFGLIIGGSAASIDAGVAVLQTAADLLGMRAQAQSADTPGQPAQDKGGTSQDKPAPQGSVAPAEGTPATVVDGNQVYGILGKEARSSSGENMGRIVDVIVDGSGRIRGAVIDFGGFLGVGSRQIAVDWSALRFSDGKGGPLIVDLTRDQLRVAPTYKPGEQIVLLGRQEPGPPASQQSSTQQPPPNPQAANQQSGNPQGADQTGSNPQSAGPNMAVPASNNASRDQPTAPNQAK